MRHSSFLLVICGLAAFIDSSGGAEESTKDDQAFKVCDPGTACRCYQEPPDENNDEDEAVVDCSEVIWDADENGKPISEPLNTANLQIQIDKFEPTIAYFSKNEIVTLKQDHILDRNIKKLKMLDFSYNRIYVIENNTFQGMDELIVLKLGHNILRNLTRGSFANGPDWKLRKLYLNNNKLTSLPGDVFEELEGLEVLVLDGNVNLNTAKLFGRGLSHLKALSLDNCNITSLDDNTFSELTSLESLSLRNNPLLVEVPEAVKKIASLKNLDLSETGITEIAENSFSKMQNLESVLFENAVFLEIIQDCAFCDLPHLKKVILKNATHLYSISPGAFGKGQEADVIPKLDEFDIEFTNISSLESDLFNIDEHTQLRISGISWNCDCNMMWLFGANLGFNERTVMSSCGSPKSLRGKMLNTLTMAELCPGRARMNQFVLSLLVLVCASIIFVLLYYVLTNYRIRNIFYRPDLPIGYSNLSKSEDEEQTKKYEHPAIDV